MSFLRSLGSLLFNRSMGAVLGVIISAQSARLLAPEQLGYVVASVSAVAIIMRLGSVGLGQAAQYFGARETVERVSFGFPLAVASVPILALSLGIVSLPAGSLGRLVGEDPRIHTIFDVLKYGIPLSFVHFIGSLYVLGKREMRAYLWLSFLPLLATLLVLSWAFLGNSPPSESVLRAWNAQYALSAVMGAVVLLLPSALPRAPVMASLSRFFAYGIRSHLVSSAAFASGRLSLIVGTWYASGREAGVFSVGRTFGESLVLVYGAIGPLVFSQVGSMGDDVERSRAFICRVSRLSFVLFIAVSLLVAIAAPIAIPLIFGNQYAESSRVVWALLPGLVFLGIQRTLENHLFGRGRQMPLVLSQVTAIVVLVAGSSVLAPSMGALGLAFATTSSFISSFIATALIAYGTDRLRPTEYLVPTRADILDVVGRLKRKRRT